MSAEKKKKIVKTIHLDADKRNGCRACEVICSAFHSQPRYSSVNPARSRIRVIHRPLRDIWLPVFAGEYAVAECPGRVKDTFARLAKNDPGPTQKASDDMDSAASRSAISGGSAIAPTGPTCRSRLLVGGLVLAFLVPGLGCTTRHLRHQEGASPGLGAIRCSLPAPTMAALAGITQSLEVSQPRRARYLGELERHCTGWPTYQQEALALACLPSHVERATLLKKAVLLQERSGFKRDVEVICPGYHRIPDPMFWTMSSIRRLVTRRYQHCRLGRLGLLSREEYLWSGALGMVAVLVYHRLVRGGLAPATARAASRLLLLDHPLRQSHSGLDRHWPLSRSATAWAFAPIVTISAQDLRCRAKIIATLRHGRVDPRDKRDGPDGFFINPLFGCLSNEAKRRRSFEIQGRAPFRGQLLVAADSRLPFRVLAEMIYTANQAGFREYQLVTRHRSLRASVIVVGTPPPKRGLNPLPMVPRVVITKQTYELHASTRTTLSKASVGPGAARRQLTGHLVRLRAELDRRGPARGGWGRILVEPRPETSVAELTAVLDALREPERSAGRCRLVFDNRRRRWILDRAGRSACLFPRPALVLGSS